MEFSVQHPQAEHLPEIKILWQEIFGDSRQFIDAFFERIFLKDNALVALSGNGKIIGAVQFLPYTFSLANGKTCCAAYFYAVMTAAEFRRKGIMARLMNAALDELKQRQTAFAFLLPQEEYLRGVYQKIGFSDTFHYPFSTIKSSEIGRKLSLDNDEIFRLYAQCRKGKNAVLLSQNQFSFVCETLFAEGGMCAETPFGTALLRPMGNNVWQVFDCFSEHFLPENFSFGMTRILDEKQISSKDLRSANFSLLMDV